MFHRNERVGAGNYAGTNGFLERAIGAALKLCRFTPLFIDLVVATGQNRLRTYRAPEDDRPVYARLPYLYLKKALKFWKRLRTTPMPQINLTRLLMILVQSKFYRLMGNIHECFT